MKFFGYELKTAKNRTIHTLTSTDANFLQALGVTNDKKAINEATYYRCIKILSETMGKLPLKIYKNTENGVERVNHYLEYLLRTEPNQYTSASVFFTTIEHMRNHYGNAYVYIERGRDFKVKGLYLLDPTNMIVYVDDAGILDQGIVYEYIDGNGDIHYFTNKELLHFKNWHTVNGLIGIPVKDVLKNNIERGNNANEFVAKLAKTGMIGDKIILQYTGDLSDKGRKQLVEGMEKYSSSSSGKFLPLPLGITATNLSSKLTDSQFLELTQYNALQIGAAFGISPQQLGDWSKGNFANSGVQQEMFYKDTLLPILRIYEQELAIKLLTKREKEEGIYFSFNVDAILRAAFKERIETYAIAINNAILTPNECRALENRKSLEGGDKLIGNGNYMPIEMAGIQWKGGD
jgi:HK97 family phage portal protein